ncbi:hypothetical protein VTO73DRAFT_667 [Trametes versicolor]
MAQAVVRTPPRPPAARRVNNVPRTAAPYNFPPGMQPPQGNPYPQEANSGDEAEETLRGRSPHRNGLRRRRSQRGLSYRSRTRSNREHQRRRVTGPGDGDGGRAVSDEPAVDPALLNAPPVPPAPAVESAHQRVRGGRTAAYAARGGISGNRARRGHVEVDMEDTMLEVYSPDPNAAKDDSDPLDIIRKTTGSLSSAQQTALGAIHPVTVKHFRLVAGVPKSASWPKLGEPREGDFMPIDFGSQVNASVNPTFLYRVAELAMQDLKAHNGLHVAWMNAPDVKLTLGVLYGVAKKVFRNFKKQYDGQFDDEKKQRLETNEQASRRLNRRKGRASNLLKAVPVYIERHGVDPSPFLIPDMMSDEASGPEDEEVEDKKTWKRRMAEKCGMKDKTDAQLKHITFFETVKPEWRSDMLSTMLHELWDIYIDGINSRTARAMSERVRSGTGRSTNKLPQFAPYNCGINREWYEKFKDQNSHRLALRNWYKYPDPPGFGDSLAAVEDGAMSPGPGAE